jgi:hypothetical protein
MTRLEKEIGPRPLQRVMAEDRRYVVLELPGSESMLVAIRKLGMAQVKGLDQFAVFEIVDANTLDAGTFSPAEGSFLVSALDREFANALTEV